MLNSKDKFESSLSKVLIKGDYCWLYKPEVCKQQRYGRFYITAKQPIAAHRYAYLIYNGITVIENNLLVLHKCDNPRCCNPNHLYLGTQKENARDREERNRGNRPVGSKQYNAKLSEELVKQIRLERKEKRTTYLAFAKRYNVSPSTIDAAINGRRWKSV
jgi:hypothetical protein